MKTDMKNIFGDMRKHLMNGVSYMLPFVVGGGVLMALAILFSGEGAVPETGFLSTLKKKFTHDEREAGKSALVMGAMGITEGAIPFAAADPLRVIPSIMVGGAVGTAMAFVLGVTNKAAWGGLIVLPLVGNPIGFILSLVVGSLVGAIMVIALKKEVKEEIGEEKSSEDEDIDIEMNF